MQSIILADLTIHLPPCLEWSSSGKVWPLIKAWRVANYWIYSQIIQKVGQLESPKIKQWLMFLSLQLLYLLLPNLDNPKKKKNQEEKTTDKVVPHTLPWCIPTFKDDVCNILLNGNATFKRHGILRSNLKDHAVKFEIVANLLDIPFLMSLKSITLMPFPNVPLHTCLWMISPSFWKK